MRIYLRHKSFFTPKRFFTPKTFFTPKIFFYYKTFFSPTNFFYNKKLGTFFDVQQFWRKIFGVKNSGVKHCFPFLSLKFKFKYLLAPQIVAHNFRLMVIFFAFVNFDPIFLFLILDQFGVILNFKF